MAKSTSKVSTSKKASGKTALKTRTKRATPAPRKHRRREVRLAFEALSIEGGLLSPEWLALAAQLQASQQVATDYRIPKGLNLRDEIGRYWRIAQAHHGEFLAGKTANAEPGALAARFALGLLRDCFGFASLTPAAPVEIADRTYPIGHAALGGRVPVVIAPADGGLDAPLPAFGEEGRRRSAFGLAQEYLNAADAALWGIATDGSTLRLLRDNVSLTRPAWIEADLARMFSEERYADFAALWLIVHDSRFGRADQPVTECALEAWRRAGLEKGTRAREYLRTGVEEAVIALGQGFLAHSDNARLRAALESGELTNKAYFQELLRLVYRLIFLLTVEERDLLHPPGSDEVAKGLYANGYSAKRLRERSVKRSAHDRYADLWEALKIAFLGLGIGEPRLALPALAGLFAKDQCRWLDSSQLENRSLLLAMFRLSWLREDGGLARVNWRDMGPEELGSVYESLLELVPYVSQDRRIFGFASGNETKGNARKTTGSYYTPDSLVQVLLDRALEPVVVDTVVKNPASPVEALLGLSVVDPACGSGHFLLAAARRLAGHVARLQTSGTPTAHEYRQALRHVVGRCIYGVDVNPMAVELCKVSLWMEAVEPGRPLTFLDAHVRCGNSLLGATPGLLAGGIPDAAFEAIEGDDRKAAAALKKRNKAARAGQESLETAFSRSAEGGTIGLVHAVQAVDAAPDADLSAVERKQLAWRTLLDSQLYVGKQLVADAWCAAFVWRKQSGPAGDLALTHDVWRAIQADPTSTLPAVVDEVRRLADEYSFFHWHLAFPQVLAKGGFDVVLGNPPWERVKLQEQEFFASRAAEIASATNAAARKKLIAALPQTQPVLWNEWCAASRVADGQSHFVRHSGRYPLCGRGDVNTYALFAEHNRSLLRSSGWAGFIVPTGIATDETTKEFFSSVISDKHLASLYDFQSGPGLFGEIGHARFKFALLALGRTAHTADFVFFARNVAELVDPQRHFTLTAEAFHILNPNTHTCPTFRARRDAELNLAIYRRTGVLWRDEEGGNKWSIQVRTRLWHMAEDSEHFRSRLQLEDQGWSLAGNRYMRLREQMRPLYEAKMLHHFDHRYGDYADKLEDSESTSLPSVTVEHLHDPSYAPLSRYWVEAKAVDARLEGIWQREWLIGWRDITNATNERTVVASLLPRTAVGHKFLLMFPECAPRAIAALYANLCAFVLDYAARQKVGGSSLTVFVLRQLPVLAPGSYDAMAPWEPAKTILDWIVPRVLELTYTAWDLKPFGHDVGYNGPPFRWDPARRMLLRCELDAAFFYLYGLSRADTDYVMDTFPIVRRDDENAHGEYLTKRVILEMYDAMFEASRTGKAYETRLAPTPAHRRVAHQDPRVAARLPSAMPTFPVGEDVARWIWAAIYEHYGVITRLDLARAFALRSHPKTLVALAADDLASTARNWAKMVGARSVRPGVLVHMLNDLEARGALRLDIEHGQSVVRAGEATPAVEAIDSWSQFESQLAFGVLAALEPADLAKVDVGLAKEDLGTQASGKR